VIKILYGNLNANCDIIMAKNGVSIRCSRFSRDRKRKNMK